MHDARQDIEQCAGMFTQQRSSKEAKTGRKNSMAATILRSSKARNDRRNVMANVITRFCGAVAIGKQCTSGGENVTARRASFLVEMLVTRLAEMCLGAVETTESELASAGPGTRRV